MPDPLRVTLVVDELNTGEAHRHLLLLAVGLKERGCHVETLLHRNERYSLGVLEQEGIPVVRVGSINRLHRIAAMRGAIRRSRPNVVISLQPGANIPAEMSGLPTRDFVVIASERNLDYASKSLRGSARRGLHRFADAVVTNSHSQRQHILELAPHLKDRVHVIVNAVDLGKFAPQPRPAPGPYGQLQILVLGQLRPEKNPFGLLEALQSVRQRRPDLDVVVDWYGDPVGAPGRPVSQWPRYYRRLQDAISQMAMGDRFRLHRAVQDVVPLYQAAHGVCLPAFYEDSSNVICEAMACGAPVLASRTGDNPRLVRQAWNGLLFDPLSLQDMAGVITRFASLPDGERREMGQAARETAEELLAPGLLIDSYRDMISRLLFDRARSRRG